MLDVRSVCCVCVWMYERCTACTSMAGLPVLLAVCGRVERQDMRMNPNELLLPHIVLLEDNCEMRCRRRHLTA